MMEGIFELTSDELSHNVREYIKNASHASKATAIMMIHFPDATDKVISSITGYSVSYIQEISFKIREATGWNRRECNNLFVKRLRKEFPINREKIEQLLPHSMRVTSDRFVIDPKLTHVNPSHRLSSAGVQLFKHYYPDMWGIDSKWKQPLCRILCLMHYEELEMWCRYLAGRCPVIYPVHLHRSANPFTPLMIAPNIVPEIANFLITSKKYQRDFALFALLNESSPDKQYRIIFPPKNAGRYCLYSHPNNQYELAGFKEHQIADKDYLVKKTSPNMRDRRTALLNAINIIQMNFQAGESGSQDVRRVLGNLMEVVERGDSTEIRLWVNALIKAPVVPRVELNDIPFDDYMKSSIVNNKPSPSIARGELQRERLDENGQPKRRPGRPKKAEEIVQTVFSREQRYKNNQT